MSEELNNRLAELARKVGVSVEHLWGVIVRQAYIDGFSSLATTVVFAALGIVITYNPEFYVPRHFPFSRRDCL